MRRLASFYGALFAVVLVIGQTAGAFTAGEHLSVARETVGIVAPESDGIVPDAESVVFDGKAFPELCAEWSQPDRSFARYHRRGMSVLQQLRELDMSTLQQNFDIALSYGDKVADLTDGSANVIVNYLVHHYVAVRFAELAAESPARQKTSIDRFLAYEARAQGYLVDAFSSAHMLIPSSGILSSVLSCNNGHVHDFFRSEGLYVIDSRGTSWRTFGDGVMDYYHAAHDPILEACATSLREVCLAYTVGQNAIPSVLAEWAEQMLGADYQAEVARWTPCQAGEYYYLEARLPALLMIPMPVSAAWSVKSDARDELDLARRTYFPQLADTGMHDPSLEPYLLQELYPGNAMGSWMRLDRLNHLAPHELVKDDPGVASVRFVQHFTIPPAYHGFITTYGMSGIVNDRGDGWGASFGMGYGIANNLLVMENPSIELRIAPAFDESERFLIMANTGATFDLSTVSLLLLGKETPEMLSRGRLDVAFVRAARKAYESSGARVAAGLEFRPLNLPYAYLGLTTRVGYQLVVLERTLHGPFIEFVVH